MKKILITGANSYIGTSFEKWVAQWPDRYVVDTLDMMDGSWKESDFSGYDSVFHVAGIAHVKETKKITELYYKVNRDLAYEVAKKAKDDGVKHFVFLSTMSVYGIERGIITKETKPYPKNNYGKSKLEAEELISELEDNNFKIAVLRPPIVYGKGCKGNYPRLAKLALKLPLFPEIKNQRSMLFIDNLSEFVKIVIDRKTSGVLWPQNMQYVCTTNLVRYIANLHCKKIRTTKLFNPILRFMKVSIVNKLFADLIYDMEMSKHIEYLYCISDFEKSIIESESK
jgi:UDP-glucose 4-epimerase